MTTCKELPNGTYYQFDFTRPENEGLCKDTYVKHDGYSVTTEGRHVEWSGHQKKPVVVVSAPQVLPASSVPPVTIKRKVLTIDKIGVGQTFIVHGKPEEVYVKISNSHVFNHKRLQMHTTDAQRFQSHLNLVVVELVVYNGK